jgi:hypothetical protein
VAAGILISLLIAPILAAFEIDLIALIDNRILTSLWPRLRTWGWVLSVAYISTEIVVLSYATLRLASLEFAMGAAALTKDAASRLAQVWEAGSRNDAFLQQLFELYEPARQHAQEALGMTVLSVRRGRELKHAGSWILPNRGPSSGGSAVMDVLSSFIEASATADRSRPGNSTQLDLKSVLVEQQARDYWDERLMRYARSDLARNRTRLLYQWKRLRSGKPVANEPELIQAVADEDRGMNYVIDNISASTVDGKPRLHVSIGRATYGQIMRSCDVLIEEAFLAAGICSGSNATGRERRRIRFRGRAILRTMPARRSLFNEPPDELFVNPGRRAVGIGLAGVVVSSDAGENTMIYKRRSFRVGTYPNMFHVVPTGMFNAKCSSEQRRNDPAKHLGRVLLTELLEECRDVRSLGGFAEDPDWLKLLLAHLEWWTAYPSDYEHGSTEVPAGSTAALRFIRARLEALGKGRRFMLGGLDDIRIYSMGLAFDLLSLRPEVCCAIQLPSELLDMSNFKLNEEGLRPFSVPSEGVDTIEQVPVMAEWVRSGFAALHLANESFLLSHSQEGLPSCTAKAFFD